MFLWNILHIYIISAIILLSISEIKTAQEIQKRNTDWGTFLSPTFLSATISNPKQFGWKQWNSLKTHTSESGLINLITRLFKFQERKNEDILSVIFFRKTITLAHKHILKWRLASCVARYLSSRGAQAVLNITVWLMTKLERKRGISLWINFRKH